MSIFQIWIQYSVRQSGWRVGVLQGYRAGRAIEAGKANQFQATNADYGPVFKEIDQFEAAVACSLFENGYY